MAPVLQWRPMPKGRQVSLHLALARARILEDSPGLALETEAARFVRVYGRVEYSSWHDASPPRSFFIAERQINLIRGKAQPTERIRCVVRRGELRVALLALCLLWGARPRLSKARRTDRPGSHSRVPNTHERVRSPWKSLGRQSIDNLSPRVAIRARVRAPAWTSTQPRPCGIFRNLTPALQLPVCIGSMKPIMEKVRT